MSAPPPKNKSDLASKIATMRIKNKEADKTTSSQHSAATTLQKTARGFISRRNTTKKVEEKKTKQMKEMNEPLPNLPKNQTKEEVDVINKGRREHVAETMRKIPNLEVIPVLKYNNFKSVESVHGVSAKPLKVFDFVNLPEGHKDLKSKNDIAGRTFYVEAKPRTGNAVRTEMIAKSPKEKDVIIQGTILDDETRAEYGLIRGKMRSGPSDYKKK